MATALVIYLVILPFTLANTPLDSSWTPLPYGQCTIPGEVEVVGSRSQGNTCNFNGAAAYMPSLWTNKYLLAVSQDLYNGFHTQDDFSLDCEVSAQTENNTDDNCGMICGWCFLINGPLGSAIYMANEIADIGAVGQNGAGINLHIDNDTSGEVRSGLGLGYDIDYRKVPCPGTEAGIYLYWRQFEHLNNYKNAIYFTPINYRIGVKAMYARHGAGAVDRKWYRMPRSWTNQYRWESYAKWASGCCPLWQPIEGNIYGSGASTFDVKIVSYLDEEVICYDLTITDNTEYETRQCLDSVGSSVQFTDNGYTIPMTSCDEQTPFPTNPPTATQITNNPTISPTNNPTPSPTNNPTPAPTNDPTTNPTLRPTESPITPGTPTNSPSDVTSKPTNNPSQAPVPQPSKDPTLPPTDNPTFRPTDSPIIPGSPTKAPSDPTVSPTSNPSLSPTLQTTSNPSLPPTLTYYPSKSPTSNPNINPRQCEDTCNSDDGMGKIKIKVKFWLFRWIMYDFTDMKCWLYKILIKWFINFEFSAYFDVCDIDIVVIGGNENIDDNLCESKPCLWIQLQDNQRRMLLQGNMSNMIDGNVSLEIISDDDNTLDAINTLSLDTIGSQLSSEFNDNFEVDIDVVIQVIEGEKGKDNSNSGDVSGYSTIEIVIGGTVCVVLIVFIVILIVVCCKRLKRRKAYKSRDIVTTEMMATKKVSTRIDQNNINIVSTEDDEYDNGTAFNTDLYATN